MRKTFEQHADRLTPAERQAIWTSLTAARAIPQRPFPRWALPAMAAAAAVIAIVLVTLPREHAPSGTPAVAARPEAHTRSESTNPAPAVAPTVAERAPVAGAVRVKRHHAAGASPAPALPVAVTTPAAAFTAPVAGLVGSVAGRVTDRLGRPVAFANVVIPGMNRGTLTDENGNYRIDHLPAAAYSVKVSMIGYKPETVAGLQVRPDRPATADVHLEDMNVATLEEVQVKAERRIDTKMSYTKQSISAERLREIPVDNFQGAVRSGSGAAVQGGELHFRGGRGGEVKFQFDGLSATPAPAAAPSPPVVPTTGGTKLPNDEAYDSMFFKHYGVNPFVSTDEDALSTFAVDVDAASYTVTRRYLQLGQLPPADAVRVEEFVNYFPQGYPHFENDDFRILVEGAPAPFGRGYQLLRIGIKGRDIAEQDRKSAQLTFVIDESGSMDRENRLGLVKRALGVLLGRLRADDQVGIVVFGTNGHVLMEPVVLGGVPSKDAWDRRDDGAEAGRAEVSRSGNRGRILDAIDELRADGSTNAAEGLQLGYEMARRAYRPGAINRVVLCSDGVANEGLTGAESILAQVRSDADRGIHLTTIGFGMGNYNDVLLEQLADKGDGNHYYVDDIGEARRVFVEHLTGTLQTIAKDAKVQVEFDTTRVLRYRLLGFENRDVADRDFRNDKVDAGEIGAGHEVTALYEVKLAPHAAPGTLATVRLRWAKPEHEGAGAPQVREIAQRFDVAALSPRFEDAAPHFRLDAAVAEFAEHLRGSYWARDGRLSDVLPVARDAARDLGDAASAEFVTLVEKAVVLDQHGKKGTTGR
jgi:Ca-activated chloride channel family protein